MLSFNSKAQIIQTIAGTGIVGSTNASGVPANININHPWDIATDSDGNVYFTEQASSVVRRIDATTGYISSIFGNLTSGDGPVGEKSPNYHLTSPSGICIDQFDQMYVSDFSNDKIYKVKLSDSSVTVICGTGFSGYYADGQPATACDIANPEGLAIGTDGLLYYVENGNYIIRRILTNGNLETVAGIAGSSGNNNGSTTSASLYNPFGLAIDSQNNLYFSEPLLGKVRKIDMAAAAVTTFAGTGTNSYNGDNILATSAQLNQPYGLSIGPDNNLYIGDNENHRIRKISLTDNIIHTIAGTGVAGNSGDGGDPLQANLNEPTGVHVASNGDIFLTQISDDVVRKISDCVVGQVTDVYTFTGVTSVACGTTVQLVLDGDLNSSEKWQWYEGFCGDTPIGDGLIISKVLQETTTFSVRAEGNCPDSAICKSVTITVAPCVNDSLNIDLEVTTAFSPNGDGVNDFLFLEAAQIHTENTVIIYNRWGDEIKTLHNYNNEDVVWNGDNEFGQIVDSGTYFYIFESGNYQFANWINVIK